MDVHTKRIHEFTSYGKGNGFFLSRGRDGKFVPVPRPDTTDNAIKEQLTRIEDKLDQLLKMTENKQ
jgi:hypothetical protein